MIQVERIGILRKAISADNYYISSSCPKAITFADGIRRRHWGLRIACIGVKDTGGDAAPFRIIFQLVYYPLLSPSISARMSGYDSLTKAERFLALNIDKLLSLLRMNYPELSPQDCARLRWKQF